MTEPARRLRHKLLTKNALCGSTSFSASALRSLPDGRYAFSLFRPSVGRSGSELLAVTAEIEVVDQTWRYCGPLSEHERAEQDSQAVPRDEGSGPRGFIHEKLS